MTFKVVVSRDPQLLSKIADDRHGLYYVRYRAKGILHKIFFKSRGALNEFCKKLELDTYA